METTSTPLPMSAPAKPRRRRWWVGALLLLALVTLAPVGFFVYSSYATRSDWAGAEAEADQLDPGWRLDDLEAKRAMIPNKENSALHIIAVERMAKGFAVRNVPKYDDLFEKLAPTAPLNAVQLNLIRTELAKIVKPLEEARKLKDMPRGRFPIVYSDDYISTMIPDHQSARTVADWLMHDAYLLAHDEHYDLALDSCRAILNAGRTMDGDLFLIAHLIRVALQTSAVHTLERVLAQGSASEESLQAMQTLLATEMKESGWLQAIRGERAGGQMLFENIANGKINSTYLAGMSGGDAANLTEWLAKSFPSTMLKFYPEHLRHMTDGVEIAKLPIHEQRAKIDLWDKKAKDRRNPVMSMLSPAMSKVHQAECRSQTTLRTALVAVACERFRLKYIDWPPTLDVLVHEKLLDAIPADPMDGEPLRYRRTKEGIVIYSIGIDLTDNQGHIDRERMHEPGVDIGFRLWHEHRRRQAPR